MNNLKNLRILRRFTLEQLADASGTSKSYLHELEKQGTSPSLDKAYSIATALGVSVYQVWPDDNQDETKKIKKTLGTLIGYLHRELGTAAAEDLLKRLD